MRAMKSWWMTRGAPLDDALKEELMALMCCESGEGLPSSPSQVGVGENVRDDARGCDVVIYVSLWLEVFGWTGAVNW